MGPIRKNAHGSSADRTVTNSRLLRITERQKQALMDNLQLEITERARKLRAQYALQAQGLQTRIELRINRIPKGLRKTTMAELLEMREEAARNQRPETATSKNGSGRPKVKTAASNARARAAASPAPVPRGIKRTSDVMDEDKENTPDPNYEIANPKRPKTGANGERRAPNPSSVLSPKSSNSRTLPHSPVSRPLGSSAKAGPARPTSPLKASSATTTNNIAGVVGEKARPGRPAAAAKPGRKPAAKTTATSTASTRAKRGAAATATTTVERTFSASSNHSGTSTGTTIIKKAGRGLMSANTAAKRAVGATAATKAKAETASTAAKRSLRKRA